MMNSVTPLSPPTPPDQQPAPARARPGGLRHSPVSVKIGLGLNLGALVFTWVSVLCPYWLVNEQFQVFLGPLYGCTDGDCSSADDPMQWQTAVAALEICALLFTPLSLVSSICFVFFPGRKATKVVLPLVTFVTAFFIISGVIVCAAKKDHFPEVMPGFRLTYDLSWAFALAVVAGVLYCGSATCFILGIVA